MNKKKEVFKPTPDGVMMGDIKDEIDEWEREIKKIDEKSSASITNGALPFSIPILTKSSDKFGHTVQIRFNVPR